MTTLYCAICRSRFEPDDDHYWITAEYRTIDDRNETEEYALCMDCVFDELDDWEEPA